LLISEIPLMVYSSLLTQSWTYLVVVELTGQVDSSGNTVSIKNNDSTQTGFLTVLVVASDCIWNVNDNFLGIRWVNIASVDLVLATGCLTFKVY
jgi:hypothetical protein